MRRSFSTFQSGWFTNECCKAFFAIVSKKNFQHYFHLCFDLWLKFCRSQRQIFYQLFSSNCPPSGTYIFEHAFPFGRVLNNRDYFHYSVDYISHVLLSTFYCQVKRVSLKMRSWRFRLILHNFCGNTRFVSKHIANSAVCLCCYFHYQNASG